MRPTPLLVLCCIAALAAPALGACGQDPPAPGGAAHTPAASPSGGSPGTGAGTNASPGASPSGAPGGAAVVTRVVFIDVGQGDATAIRSGSWTGLIDGGPAVTAGAVTAAVRRLGGGRLDALIVSHTHLDHTGGLAAEIRALRPRRAFVAGRVDRALARVFRLAGTSVTQVRSGRELRCGAATARVLSPERLSGDANQDSLVVSFAAAGRRLLFTGDCTGPAEAAVASICARGPPLQVLKVAHHGSRYSTTAAFLRAVRPRVAVVSVGPNPYGHPSPQTLRRLRRAGVRILTTQARGDITLTLKPGHAPRWSFSAR